MESARYVSRAAVTKTAILLSAVLLTFASVGAQTSPKTTASKKKPAVTTASKRPLTRTSRTAVASARHGRTSLTRDEASSATKRVGTRRVVVTRKLVHGRWVRTTQIVHAAPVPSYQTRPDPERYQQIQQSLANNGYFKGQVNGEWGDDSVDALKRFQTDHKLVNDGKISSLSLIGLGLGPNRESTQKPVVKDSADSTPPTAQPVPSDTVHN